MRPPSYKVLKALEVAIDIVTATPRGGDLPDEDNLGPDDPTDKDFEAADHWVRDALTAEGLRWAMSKRKQP